MARFLPTVTMNIKREYFADILALPRRKDVEYREMKPYWDRRVGALTKGPFKLRLLNGMRPPVPEATVMVKKVVVNHSSGHYELHLGRVVGVKHWDRTREQPSNL